MNIFKTLSAIPALLLAANALSSTVSAAQADPAIVAELQANPILAATVNQFSHDWRIFTADVTKAKRANFFTVWGPLFHVFADGTNLEAEVAAAQHEPGILAALEHAPNLKAAIQAASSEWRDVEAAVKALHG